VPYKRLSVPSAQERETWRRIQQTFKAKAQAACGSEEVLALLRSPSFCFLPGFYAQATTPERRI
jgi:hypothetical protein